MEETAAECSWARVLRALVAELESVRALEVGRVARVVEPGVIAAHPRVVVWLFWCVVRGHRRRAVGLL